MLFLENKALKNSLFYGFESLVDLIRFDDIKKFEDENYELVGAWEEGERTDYVSPNLYYYCFYRYFSFRHRQHKDFLITIALKMIRDKQDRPMYSEQDFHVMIDIRVRDESADNLYHGWQRKEVWTGDVVARTCFPKIQEMIAYLEEKRNLMIQKIDEINASFKTPYKVDVQWFLIERLLEECGEEVIVDIKTKDKQTYTMSETDYLQHYKIVKKFDGYARKNKLTFEDIRTSKQITIEQQDIKSHKVKPLQKMQSKKRT